MHAFRTDEEASDVARKTDEKAIAQFLLSTRNDVARLTRLLTDPSLRSGRGFVDTVRELMDKLEGSIFAFKRDSKQQYDALREEEAVLVKGMESFDVRLERMLAEKDTDDAYLLDDDDGDDDRLYEDDDDEAMDAAVDRVLSSHRSRPVKSASSSSSSSAQQATQAVVLPEVTACDAFLQEHGGPSLGWDDRDHARFLRLLSKYKGNKEELYASVAAQVPNCTFEKVRLHDTLYSRLLELQEAKRKAIHAWREEKEQRRRQAILDAELQQQQQQQQQKQADKNGTAFDESGREKTREEEEEEERQKRKRLEQWRRERKEKEEEEARMKDIEARAKKARELEAQLQRAAEKERLEAYKATKRLEHEMQAQRAREEEERRTQQAMAHFTRDDLQRKHERDLAITLRRQEAKMRREMAEEEHKKRVEALAKRASSALKIAAHVERDASRLVRPTSAARMREKATREGEDRPEFTGGRGMERIQVIQHRSVPSWRKS
jgi:hypothetical protein